MTEPRGIRALVPVVIAAIVAMPFLPALDGQFLDWDDSVNFSSNPHYRGLGWPQIRWMFSTTLMGHYIPLTWMSLGLNYVVGGMNPWGYHLGNLLLHAANAVLVYLIARRLIAAATARARQDAQSGAALTWSSAFAALLFGVHPLRVESVAWITERRDVLCGLFFLLSVLAYLKSVEDVRGMNSPPRWMSLAAFAAALLSKAAAMPMPAVLLLLDIYPLRRLHAGWKRLVYEKVPYMALALATAAVALIALRRGATVTSYDHYGAGARLGMVSYSLLFYPISFVWPVHLSPMYELPARVTLDAWPFGAALIGVVAATALLVLARRRWPSMLAAWVYSALMVLPISGVVHSGSQLTNDRYSYLSGIGFALLGGAALWSGLRLRERGRISMPTAVALRGAAALTVVFLGFTASTQAHAWRDSETLWRWAVDMDPACALCHGNLGAAITNSPTGSARLEEADTHLRRALALRPDSPVPHFNLGNLFMIRRQYAEAAAEFETYGRLAPYSTRGMARLGLLALLQGRHVEAISLLTRARGAPSAAEPASTIDPRDALSAAVDLVEDDPGTLSLLGQVLLEQGHPLEAVKALRRAVALAPGTTAAHTILVQAYRKTGQPDLAREELGKIERVDPGAAARIPLH